MQVNINGHRPVFALSKLLFSALRLIFHPGLKLMLDKLMFGLVFVDLWGSIHDLNHNIPCCSALAECLSIVGWTMWAHKAFMSIIKSAGRKDTLMMEYHPCFLVIFVAWI